MATTDAYAHGGPVIGGSAATTFVHGPQVHSDIVIEWDFGLGLEAVTEFLYDAESFTGRDWPSQLQGKAGPGRLQMEFHNGDDRFSYFNTASPLNQGGRSLDPGRTIRVRTSDATDIDPIVLARDRFDGDGGITTDELGTTWEHQTGHVFTRVDGNATAPTAGQESSMIIDTGATDYYVQATIAEAGDHVDPVAGLQESNEIRLIYRWQDSSNYSYLAFYQFTSGGTGGQQNALEAFDVVAGVTTSIFGPTADIQSGSTDAQGDHRRRVTIGVHAAGSVVNYYVNGARRTLVNETGLQLDETHVGLYAYYGVGNRAPAIDEFAVWDRFPSDTEGVIWTGHIVDVFPTAPAQGAPKTVTVTAEGTLANLAQAEIQPQPWAGRISTGMAIGDAVQLAGLLYPPGLIALGDISAGSSDDAEINALTHCRKLEEVEAGFLHEAPEGWLTFEERSYRNSLTTEAVFSDAEGAQFAYVDFELLQWRRELINRVTAGVSYGAPDLVVVGGGTNTGTASGVARPISFTMPASIDDGDLFVVFITSTIADDNENWLTPIFWVRERDTGASSSKRTQIYTHIAAASEASSSITFYNDSAAAGGSYILRYYQVRNWYGNHEGIQVGQWTGNPGTGADPEPILPPWGDTNPSAFLASRSGVNRAGSGSITNPTYPLGYVNTFSVFQNGSGSDIHDCGMQLCTKLAMTAIEDPSTFSGFAGLQDAETNVVAVRGRNGSPPEPRGRLRVTVEDRDSQRKHNTVAAYDGCDLFPDETTAEEWCDLMLARYSGLRPIVRFSFVATTSGAYRAQAYKRRLSDRVRVIATNGAGMGIDADFHIESIRHRWTQAGKLWVTTWELSPA